MNITETTQDIEPLLDFLKRNRGFDFTGYKRTSLVRRIDKRMQMIGINTYAEFTDYLEVHPDEFTHLFNTILINVTSFFRDQPAWDYLTDEIIPRILRSRKPGDQIRIWSAGCASGEEAYSIAMILADHVGKENFSSQVKIYATDIDEEALTKARLATYSEKDIEDVPPERLERYFDRVGDHYVFNKEIRRSVIFGRHDVIQDAPISKIDLLICRNLLMYFNADTQSRVLARLHFALNNNGFLFLGRAEMLLTHSHIFTPVDLKMRMFARVPKPDIRDRLMIMAQTGNEEAVNGIVKNIRIRDVAFDTSPVGQIVVDSAGMLLLANEYVRVQFNINFQDIGHPFKDTQLSYRPVELRAFIEKALHEQRETPLRNVEWISPTGETRFLDIIITPLMNNEADLPMVNLAFLDVTTQVHLQQKLERKNQELETALEELQSTNEELETTNEELQSTIEELETTNEELQSTNEELETMNEELQSTNEELETMNDEMRIRTEDLNRVNRFLEMILTSIRFGVIVLDPDMHVLVWNRTAEDLWGLRSEEVVGQNFLNLDIGLPVSDLKPKIRTVVSGEKKWDNVALQALNRRGKQIDCVVSIFPFIDNDQSNHGSLMVIYEKNNLPV